jgi:hypothetical protein
MGQRNPASPKGWLKAYQQWDKPPIAGFLPSTVFMVSKQHLLEASLGRQLSTQL